MLILVVVMFLKQKDKPEADQSKKELPFTFKGKLHPKHFPYIAHFFVKPGVFVDKH